MLKLKELRFSGIGRFVEEQVIDFTKLANLVQIDGQNLNTNGSSGAGKSTVFNALDYLLGLNDIPNTVLQSRLTKEALNVTGVFELDGKTLTISRGKKLSVEFDGELTVGSNKLAEEKLDQILAMPRQMFRLLLHKRQGEGGFFLHFTPKETHEFLTDCLGHGDLKRKSELLDKNVKELEEKLASLLSKVEAGKASLTATQNALAALGSAPVKEVGQDLILTLKAKAEASASELAAIQTRHKLESEALELTRPVPKTTTPDSSKRTSYEKEINEVRAEASRLVLAERDRVSELNNQISTLKLQASQLKHQIQTSEAVKSEASKCALEIKTIRDHKCPTCDQSWLTDSAKTAENALIEKVKNLKDKIAQGAQAQLDLAKVEKDIETLTSQAVLVIPEGVTQLQAREKELEALISEEKQKENDFSAAQNHINRTISAEFAEKQKELLRKHSLEADQARGQVDIDRRTLEAAVNKMKSYEEARMRYERTLKSLKEQEQRTLDDLTANSVLYLAVEEQFQLAEEAKRAIKSFTSCSFDDALEEIGDTATRIIRGIPNMANATIQLQGVRETKDGKVKEEVNAIINVDGEVAIPIKSLSGGERSSVDLAVDLAVIDLLESKTNKGIDIFILDEPFTGLDTVSIEMALEVLKNSNLSKRLVIVDHNPEVKQMVESRLVVVREGTTSKVMQQ